MDENNDGFQPLDDQQGFGGQDGQPEQPTQEVPTQPTQEVPVQPTQQQAPVNPVFQPGYQDGYQRGAQAGYAAGYQAGTGSSQSYGSYGAQGSSADAAQNTTQRPPVPGTYGSSSQASNAQSPVPAGGEPKHKGKKSHPALKAGLVGLLGGVLGAAALTGVLLCTGVIGKSSTSLSSGTTQSVTINASDEDTTTANAAAAKALPSVCTVNVTTSSSSGLGSGVIYDTDGNIITNNHVIEDAESITVTINGKTYDATLVGTDASSDIAVIKADLGGDTVTPIEVADSSELQVGDWVMSVGSPFGLDQSVSQGIVSALTRNTLLQSSSGNTLYTNLIQVDCSINPGNSGGALVNSQGQLVGICTLYTSSTQSFAGIGFAIPGNYAIQLADKIISGETVTHAHIGVSMQTVNSSNAKANKLSVDSGAYVSEVTENGPAANAGIEKGDIITSIDGTTMGSADDVILAVRSHNIGDTVSVTVMRGSEEKTFEVTLDSDEELQKEQSTTSDINSYLNNNTNSDTNSDTNSNTDLLEEIQQYLRQRNNGTNGNGGSGSNGYGNGYGNNGYGYGN